MRQLLHCRRKVTLLFIELCLYLIKSTYNNVFQVNSLNNNLEVMSNMNYTVTNRYGKLSVRGTYADHNF